MREDLPELVQDLLKRIIDAEVENVFQDVMSGDDMDPMVADLINSDDVVKAYVKDMAMVEVGFAAAYAPTADETDTAVAAIKAYLNGYVEDEINNAIDPTEITAAIDAEVVSVLRDYSEYLPYLPYLQAVTTFDKLAAGDISGLAWALGSDELQTLIAEAGISDATMNEAMDALAKAIEALPADACVTINGVEFCEDELAAVKAAAQSHDIADVCDELANLVARLGGLSLKTCQSVPVEVAYGARSETCILHIVVA